MRVIKILGVRLDLMFSPRRLAFGLEHHPSWGLGVYLGPFTLWVIKEN